MLKLWNVFSDNCLISKYFLNFTQGGMVCYKFLILCFVTKKHIYVSKRTCPFLCLIIVVKLMRVYYRKHMWQEFLMAILCNVAFKLMRGRDGVRLDSSLWCPFMEKHALIRDGLIYPDWSTFALSLFSLLFVSVALYLTKVMETTFVVPLSFACGQGNFISVTLWKKVNDHSEIAAWTKGGTSFDIFWLLLGYWQKTGKLEKFGIIVWQMFYNYPIDTFQ